MFSPDLPFQPGMIGKGIDTFLFEPGGDGIGRRRLDTHFYGLRRLGVEIDDGEFEFTAKARLEGALASPRPPSPEPRRPSPRAGREAAERNLKMALAYEPTNPRFLQEMEQLEKSRPKADFRIK